MTPKFFWKLIRAHEWWNYKIPPALAMAYAFAWSKNVPFGTLFGPTLLILLAGFSAGIYASVFNDYMDMEQDKQADKETPMMSLSAWQRHSVIIFSLSLDLLVAFLLLRLPLSLFCFTMIWLGYTAYSLPPFRLKERGVLGVLCIAVGEHVLATLLSISIVSEINGLQVPFWPALAACVWSLCFGCRGILWHQIADVENDLKVGCKTMGANLGATALRRFGNFFVFPLEIICFGTVLIFTNNILAWCLLPIHLLLEYLRVKDMKANIIIVNPAPNARFALFEYYQLFFPISILISAIAKDIRAGALLAAFIILFWSPVSLSFSHIKHFIYWLLIVPLKDRLKKS